MLGRGAYGNVHAGVVVAGGKREEVAVKTVSRKQALEREVTALLHFQGHAHIVACLRVIRPRSLIVMKRHSGDLRVYFDERKVGKRIPRLFDEIDRGIMVDASSGMQFMAQKAFVHRDLKVGNILIDKIEEPSQVRYRAVVGDLGQCLHHDSLPSAKCAGTPLCRAPETLNDPPLFSEQSDKYSFGIVLLCTLLRRDIEVIDFRDVVAGAGTAEVEEKVRSGERPVIPYGTQDAMSKLLDQCWKQMPSERGTFADLTYQLQQVPLHR